MKAGEIPTAPVDLNFAKLHDDYLTISCVIDGVKCISSPSWCGFPVECPVSANLFNCLHLIPLTIQRIIDMDCDFR